MGTQKIILEAPEFGAGRQCDARPIDLQKISEIANNVAAEEANILKAFSTHLRQTMVTLPMMKRAEKVAVLKEIAEKSRDYGAKNLYECASKWAKKTSDAGLMANYMKSNIELVSFISSLSRV